MAKQTYNHAFDIAFAISGSIHPKGEDVTPRMIREAIMLKLGEMDDTELLEAVGAPFDTYEETPLSKPRKKRAK
jgi:hypothetical protein